LVGNARNCKRSVSADRLKPPKPIGRAPHDEADTGQVGALRASAASLRICARRTRDHRDPVNGRSELHAEHKVARNYGFPGRTCSRKFVEVPRSRDISLRRTRTPDQVLSPPNLFDGACVSSARSLRRDNAERHAKGCAGEPARPMWNN
jgi:hypothetical protein